MFDDVAQFYYRKLTPEEAKIYKEYLEGQRKQDKDEEEKKDE